MTHTFWFNTAINLIASYLSISQCLTTRLPHPVSVNLSSPSLQPEQDVHLKSPFFMILKLKLYKHQRAGGESWSGARAINRPQRWQENSAAFTIMKNKGSLTEQAGKWSRVWTGFVHTAVISCSAKHSAAIKGTENVFFPGCWIYLLKDLICFLISCAGIANMWLRIAWFTFWLRKHKVVLPCYSMVHYDKAAYIMWYLIQHHSSAIFKEAYTAAVKTDHRHHCDTISPETYGTDS